MSNTIKSFLRFYKSIITKLLPITSKNKSIHYIVNYINYTNYLTSSGQPIKPQLLLIQASGYKTVINLAPYDLIENPLKNEEKIVTKLGMKYIHIPIEMLKPTQKDFDAFVDTVKSTPCDKIWVHCAIGLRTSAFIYKYRRSIMGEDEQTVIWDLRKTWESFGTWKKFVFNDEPTPN